MRIRAIKPEFFTHEALFEAEKAFKLPLRVAFAGLWCAADREGRFKWEPRRLGVQILPYDLVDFSRVLHALMTRCFIVKYCVKGVWYGLIPGFSRHQVINNRESKSTLPEPSENIEDLLVLARELDALTTRDGREGHACQGEGKGRKGKEGIASSDASTTDSVNGDGKTTRPRNLAFDALAEVSHIDLASVTPSQGALIAKALSGITSALPGKSPEEVAAEIRRRGAIYFENMPPGTTLTPTALEKHWGSCNASRPRQTNQTPPWKERQELDQAIAAHAANRDWIDFDPSKVTPELKADLAAKIARRNSLK